MAGVQAAFGLMAAKGVLPMKMCPSPGILLHKVAPSAGGPSKTGLQRMWPCTRLQCKDPPLLLCLQVRRSKMGTHRRPGLLLPRLLHVLRQLLRLPGLLLSLLLLRHLPAAARLLERRLAWPVLEAKWAMPRWQWLLLLGGRQACGTFLCSLTAPRRLPLLPRALGNTALLPAASTVAALLQHRSFWHRHRAAAAIILQAGKGKTSSMLLTQAATASSSRGSTGTA